MTEQEKNDLYQEAKALALAAPVLIPLIENRKRIAYEKLIASFRGGQTEQNLIAELSALEGLMRDITQKQLTYETMEKRK